MRREHGATELKRKLVQRGHAVAEAANAVAELSAERLQSDPRFAASLARMRSAKGYGPVYIRGDLAARGIAREIIEAAIATLEVKWETVVREVRRKRFGAPPSESAERVKQMRFLQQRGFTHEQIRAAFDVEDND